MAAKWLVGTSGFFYDHWRSRFYPEKLAKAKWLEFYATHFATVELNSSFYRLPSEAAFANWRDSTPADLKEIYIYFNNDAEAFAISNATTIRGYLQAGRDS